MDFNLPGSLKKVNVMFTANCLENFTASKWVCWWHFLSCSSSETRRKQICEGEEGSFTRRQKRKCLTGEMTRYETSVSKSWSWNRQTTLRKGKRLLFIVKLRTGGLGRRCNPYHVLPPALCTQASPPTYTKLNISRRKEHIWYRQSTVVRVLCVVSGCIFSN